MTLSSDPALENPASSPPVLELFDLHLGYRGATLLPGMSLSIRRGELWAIIGPNGAGKTTLLKTLLGLIPAVEGTCRWASGIPIGYVPQRATLDQSVPARVIDVVRGGVERGWSFLWPGYCYLRRHDIRRALTETRVESLAHRPYTELSEGQRQRVLMARALSSNPAVLVLDEPTAAMDVSAERTVFELIEALRRDRQLAVLLVSHHLSLVAEYATHLILVDKDHQLAVHGDVPSMATDERVIEQYGQLLAHRIATVGKEAS